MKQSLNYKGRAGFYLPAIMVDIDGGLFVLCLLENGELCANAE